MKDIIESPSIKLFSGFENGLLECPAMLLKRLWRNISVGQCWNPGKADCLRDSVFTLSFSFLVVFGDINLMEVYLLKLSFES